MANVTCAPGHGRIYPLNITYNGKCEQEITTEHECRVAAENNQIASGDIDGYGGRRDGEHLGILSSSSTSPMNGRHHSFLKKSLLGCKPHPDYETTYYRSPMKRRHHSFLKKSFLGTSRIPTTRPRTP